MIIINIIQNVLISIIALFILYVFFLSVFALFYRNKRDFTTDKYRKFAIVIPAHNEELLISHTLYSLFSLIYPKSKYEVFVVADNCTDDTARIARNIGATVMEREHETLRGKGHALRWAFSEILIKDEFEGLVVFDADSQISGNYLCVMNHYMENGSRVIQSSDLVQPQPGVWSSEMTRIGFTLYNLVRPLGRNFLNLSMGLRGNGMCFHPQVLKQIPWEAYSLTEDIEYGILLILKGEKIQFAPEANVIAKMPENSKNAESQRERWEMGRYPIIARYSLPLIRKFFKTGNLSYLDTFIDLIMPPMVNLMIMILMFTVLNLIPALFGIGNFMFFTLVWGTLFALSIIHLLIGFKAADVDRNLYKALIHVPRYAFWKLMLYIKAFAKGKEENWIRTTR
ncbi:MAG: glycosyltransferase family 2 protein [Gracilimonas sp.]|nr:glycosyltransferase family 2 protein [Gracilimonas sp.]